MKVNPKKGFCGGNCGSNSGGQHNCGSCSSCAGQKKKSVKKHTPALGPYALLSSHSSSSVRKIILNVVDEQIKKQVQKLGNCFAFVFNPKGYNFSVLIVFNSNFQVKVILSWCKECQMFHIDVARSIVFDDIDMYGAEVSAKVEEMKKGKFSNT